MVISFATETETVSDADTDAVTGAIAGAEVGEIVDTATAAVAVTGVRGTGFSKTFAYTSNPW
jgi:hypothetical protein